VFAFMADDNPTNKRFEYISLNDETIHETCERFTEEMRTEPTTSKPFRISSAHMSLRLRPIRRAVVDPDTAVPIVQVRPVSTQQQMEINHSLLP
jgi:hypothetical protein